MPESSLVVLEGADEHDLTKLAEYREIGGFEALAKARAQEPGWVIEELNAANLRGRGGAFFATTAGIVTAVAVGAGVTAAVVATTNNASASGG